MTHRIPASVANSTVEMCIDEYVRLVRDRDMLKDHWFHGLSFMALADKYDMSLPAVKLIVYKVGDAVLEMAQQKQY